MRRTVPIIFGLMLGACTTLDIKPAKTQVNPDIPAANSQNATSGATAKWVVTAASADLPRTDWVNGFGDTALSALVNTALAKNTDIRASEARYRAALLRADVAGADLLPSVSASTGLSRREFGDDLIPGTTGLSAGVNASWEFDVWGRIRDGVDASTLEASASNADYAGARLAIAAQVTQTWFNLLEASLLTELSQRDVDTQSRALRLTTRRFDGGITDSSDVRLARSSLANAEALQASRKQRLSSLSRGLEVLLREYPSEALSSNLDLPDLPPLTGVSGPAYVLRHRPDLLAAERRMTAAGLQVDVARKALLPRLSFDGGLNGSGNSISNFFDIDALIANLAGNLVQPIFQGGRLKGNIAIQEEVLRQQLEAYTGTVLNAYLEVENALDAEKRLAEREAALTRSVNEAVKAEERLELRYTEGLASILQLLDSQSRRLNAESQLIGARKERLANRVRLHVALGGGDISAVN